MKYLTIFIVAFLGIVSGQDFVFFTNSAVTTYWDPSLGSYSSPAFVELIFDSKFPVSNLHVFSGTNALKLRWKSMEAGDWRLGVAGSGNPLFNVNNKDTLSFYIYSETAISGNFLPKLYLQDNVGQQTGSVSMSNYLSELPAFSWKRVLVPLSLFRNNAGSTDLTKIKYVFFAKDAADTTQRITFIDEVRMVLKGSIDPVPPSVPGLPVAKGYEKHFDLRWMKSPENDVMGYNIYKKEGINYIRIGNTTANENYYYEWTGAMGNSRVFAITAFDSSYNESERTVDLPVTTSQMTDEDFLDMVQAATFRYFWHYAHPVSGLARERLNSGETVTIGGSGFGVMGIPVGIERGYITREEGAERALKIVNFLLTKADRFHGAWSHWLNGTTGDVIPFSTYDNGGDLVETAFMVQGLLTLRQYFDAASPLETELRTKLTEAWESVEWNWYRRYTNTYKLYWHWSPNYGWQMNMPVTGYMEAMIMYLLAVASPTYPMPAQAYWLGWTVNSGYQNTGTYYGHRLWVGQNTGGPLFFAHYSYLGFDPRHKRDMYANYFEHNKNQTLVNRAYCIANPKGYAGYNANTWGLTASDNPWGYSAHEPTSWGDNGTIAPTAALSSMPYTPAESMAALKNMYRTYGENLWGVYGFKDAFNPQQNWFASSYLAIDQGPILAMIENHRTGLLWNNFMKNPEIAPMLTAVGFTADTTTSIEDEVIEIPTEFKLHGNYPNPFNPSTKLVFDLPESGKVGIEIYDALANRVFDVEEIYQTGRNEFIWSGITTSGRQVPSGVYIYRITSGEKVLGGKMVLLK
ncbi:MAG: T9SS type A sorting domain-containing protein [Ignavibacteriales bacterium]|jgi:hypothetical protein|nr:T9SS type A sorting domain-containing protein [Ignavibacteriales bacterium]MBK8661369.1 T9SS type A sorting domain-containing protein [Ignavibacteriales bacterium]